MKLCATLLALCPALAFANAIRNAEPGPQQVLPSADQRWSDLAKAEAPSFRRHIIPFMARAGCSGRECHGSFSGQGGFQLSLFGYDFDKDHAEITADPEDGSRVDLEHPERSLILAKPSLTEGEKHKGKKVIEKGSWEYNLLLKWIQAGAKNDLAETGEFDRLDVLPHEIVFQKPGDTAQLRVLAHWKDGTVEDVTQLTRFRTNDESVAEISATGVVTCKEKGDTHVVAFYDNGVEPIPVMLPVSNAKVVAQTHTKVDELVLAKLRKVGIQPSDVCSDGDFLRRASLDVTGTLPTPAEIEAFAADKTPDKRAKKIEELLARPGYAAWWATKLCDFTGNNPRLIRSSVNGTRNITGEMSRQWYDWIEERVAANTPYDQIAAGILLATTRTEPEQSYADMAGELGSYFRKDQHVDFATRANMPWFWARSNVQKPEEKALAFAHTFLGVRIECAQCHKHPFDQWTKQDFEQFQAFFTPVVYGERRGGKGEPVETMSARSLKAEIDAKVGAQMDAMTKPEEPAMAAMTDAAAGKTNEAPKADEKMEAKAGTPATATAAAATVAPKQEAAPAAPAPKPAEKTLEEKRAAAKRDAKLRQEQQKRSQAEITRRLDAGEPIPWSEVYIDAKRTAQRKDDGKKKDVKGGSRVITPKILGGEEVVLATYNDPRQPLMDWLKAKENPYFAKAFVNRVWAGYFSRGIVEPADDLNLANAPSNGPLLDYLTQGFAAHGYDMKWLHREILNSDTYQRSWKTNATNEQDEKNFSHAVIRRLPAEVVYDALTMATAGHEQLKKFPTEIMDRSIGPVGVAQQQVKGGKQIEAYALAIFGKPARETNCDCERVTDPTLLQTIYTRNDQSVLRRLDGNGGWIDELRRAANPRGNDRSPAALSEKLARGREKLAALQAPAKPAEGDADAQARYAEESRRYEARAAEFKGRLAELEKELAAAKPEEPAFNTDHAIREVFLRTVSREPNAAELQQAQGDVAAAKSPVDGIRDLLWAMLNTREFMVNR